MSGAKERRLHLFLSCEHGGNQIPALFNPLFESASDLLSTHRGYDLGAIELFNNLKRLQPSFAISSEVSRMLVDLNRSLHRRSLFSEITRPLSRETKTDILDRYYFPYRKAFEEAVNEVVDENLVFHLSVHSFTPVLNGNTRNTDIGILYHPGRNNERMFAKIWKEEMNRLLPNMRVRYNYPYLGKPDGHVAYYRKRFDDAHYMGIEFELNQKFAFDNDVYHFVNQSLSAAIGRFGELLCFLH